MREHRLPRGLGKPVLHGCRRIQTPVWCVRIVGRASPVFRGACVIAQSRGVNPNRDVIMNLAGKRALVTGGAVRIGRAICEALAKRGCIVVIHYRNSEEEAHLLAGSLKVDGGEAYAVQSDLGDESTCARLIEASIERAGGLDILVNNAAVFNRDALLETTEAKLLSELQTNAFAPIFLTRALAQRTERGKIVNLLDQRIEGLEIGALAYNLSKRMLADFTELAALELAPGFTVNGVAPGPILPPPGEGDERTRELAGATPLGVPLTPEAVAGAVVYLLEADGVTGQTIFVDGGQRLLRTGHPLLAGVAGKPLGPRGDAQSSA